MSTITIPTPHVPFGPTHVPEHVADADYLRGAVRNIEYREQGEKLWGSNLTATVIKLLNDAAEAIMVAGEQAAERERTSGLVVNGVCADPNCSTCDDQQ